MLVCTHVTEDSSGYVRWYAKGRVEKPINTTRPFPPVYCSPSMDERYKPNGGGEVRGEKSRASLCEPTQTRGPPVGGRRPCPRWRQRRGESRTFLWKLFVFVYSRLNLLRDYIHIYILYLYTFVVTVIAFVCYYYYFSPCFFRWLGRNIIFFCLRKKKSFSDCDYASFIARI